MKHNTLKRLASLATAGALALSLAVPAFAAETPVDERTTTVWDDIVFEGALSAPTIAVEVDAGEPSLILNPYELSYTIPGTDKAVDPDEIDTVVSNVGLITNNTQIPVNVAVTVTGSIPSTASGAEVNSGASFASAAIASGSKNKEIYMRFLMQGTEAGTNGEVDRSSIEWDIDNWDTQTVWTKDNVALTGNQADPIIVKDDAVEKGTEFKGTSTSVYYIMGAQTTETGKEPVPTYAAFKLIGDMNTKAEENWTEDDTVGVTVAFTFTVINPANLPTV